MLHAAFVLLVGVLTGAAGLSLPGCSPKIEVALGGFPERDLAPSVVLADPGAGAAKVAMIDVRGLIVDAHKPNIMGPNVNPVDRFMIHLAMAEQDPSVRAVIVRINSPGGTVTGSDIMYQELRRFAMATKKPVVASMGEIAASGGYYLALASDHLIAEPTSITGSIGVIMPTFNFSEGLDKIGIKSRSVKSGRNKDMANPFEPMREGHFDVLQTIVDGYAARFRGMVRERRQIEDSRFEEATDGRVFSGEQALELGLIDEVGGVREAFAAAKRLAGLRAASLVKFSDKDDPARSAYALAQVPTPGSNPSTGVSLRMDFHAPLAGIPAEETSGMFYLWMPALE
jgi:protease-4